MIKLFLKISLVGLLAVGCSSSPKSEEVDPIADDTPPKAEKKAEAVAAKPTETKLVEMKPVAKTEEAAPPPAAEPKSARYEALNSAISVGNDDKIKSMSIELLQNNPKDMKALNTLAMLNFKKGNSEAALMLLNKALVLNPKSSTVYNNLGMISLSRGEKREAIEMFKKALEFDSENYVAGANLGSIYIREKDYNKVIFALEKAVEDKKADLSSMNNYAIALAATGKPQDAENVYQDILKESPSNKNVMLNLAIVLIEKLNKHSDGLDLLNRLKFVGADFESRQVIKELENKAKAGLK